MNVVIREFSFAPMIEKLGRVLPEAMRVLPELVIDQARLMISNSGGTVGMVQIIPPAHAGVKGPSAGKHGMRKVAGDISRVYLTPGGAYDEIKESHGEAAAKGFYVAVKRKGNAAEAERILRATSSRYKNAGVGPFDGGAQHRALRLRDGTIGKKALPRLVVLDPKVLAEYIKHKQQNVGIMASAFNRAAAQFGAKGMPEYVTRHGDRFSSVQILHTATAFFIVMTPRLNFGEEDIARRWNYVLRYRMNSMDTRGYITRIKKVFLEPARAAS